MKRRISKRLADIVDALPLFDGARVLEIGCGPGVAAREIFNRVGEGCVLGIDRRQRLSPPLKVAPKKKWQQED